MLKPAVARQLMTQAIEEAAKSKTEDHGVHPHVGALIADKSGKVLYRAHRGEEAACHAEFLCLKKAQDDDRDLSDCALFVTLEPCTARGPDKTPCAQRIIESKIGQVYIGMLDPNPAICGRGETCLRSAISQVERFPSKLVTQIAQMNKEFVDLHKRAHLSQGSLYVKSQIHRLMRDELVRSGIPLDEDLPVATDLTTSDIVRVCEAACVRASVSNVDVARAVQDARGVAYDRKYAARTYDDDGRGLGDYWEREVRSILTKLRAPDYPKRSLIVVGIGNGLEGNNLYIDCRSMTAVDIGEKSLRRARKVLPEAKFLCAPAEDLASIASGSQDVYISLRTFQSTYFDRNAAVREAYRVVRQGGIVLISVANAFLEQGALIPGLLIPGTAVVNRDLGYEIAGQVRSRMSVLGFEEIGVASSLDEIYVYGRRGR